MRIENCFLALALLASAVNAQPFLFHGELPATGVPVRTPSGEVSARTTAVTPSPLLTAVVITSTLTADSLDLVTKSLQALYKTTGANLRLAMISSAGTQTAGPFRTRREFQDALHEIAIDQNPASAEPAHFYSTLPLKLHEFGPDWSSVVLIAKLPPIDPRLEAYAASFLTARIAAQKVRFSYWNVDGPKVEILNGPVSATSGEALGPDLDITVSTEPFFELTWDEPAPVRGLASHQDTLMLPGASVTLAHTTAAARLDLPDLERYALYRQNVLAATELATQNGKENEFRASLDLVLEVNPGDRQALRLGADFYVRHNGHAEAARLLENLAELDPANAALFAEIGHQRFLAGDMPSAEKHLLKARELKFSNADVSEELFHIRFAKQDFPGSLPLVEETLAALPKRQDLWFARADISGKLDDWKRQADSLDRALELGGLHIDRRTAAVNLYLAHQEPTKAAAHVDAVLAAMPADAPVRSTYAEFLEQLHRPEEALQLWKQTVEIDQANEPAHFAVTRLLLSKKDVPAALEASEAGIAAAPKSARLRLSQIDALYGQNRIYEARRAITAAQSIDDVALLKRSAQIEDAYGGNAAGTYGRLAEMLQKSASPDLAPVLERGLQVSLREADDRQSLWFAQRLDTLRPVNAHALAAKDTVAIPGGLAALAFMAHSKESSTPAEFLRDYARSVVSNGHISGPKDPYVDALRNYFERVTALIQLGVRGKDGVTIDLSVNDKSSLQKTEKVMGMLGWKLTKAKGHWSIESGVKSTQAHRQEFASALAIDQVGMEQAFASGKSFQLEIPVQNVSIKLPEQVWREQMYPGEKFAAGFAEALVRVPRLAMCYLALSELDDPTVAALTAAIPLKTLLEKYADSLTILSSALVISGGKVQSPGDPECWKALVGADPADATKFVRALFEKDGGRVLAYYSILCQLDFEHQRFYTRNVARLRRFYDLYRETPEIKAGVRQTIIHNSLFGNFLREVPLNDDGSVDFPGSPEIWMVAKGQSHSAAHSAHLLKKAKVKAAPDLEDEILLRLARTRYKDGGWARSELDNFLAVVRIDSHRSEPLDEESALALAQNYSRYQAVFPYFSVFTGLTSREYAEFFRFGAKLQGAPFPELNLSLGLFHSWVELLRLSLVAHTITDAEATGLFFELAKSLADAGSHADYSRASITMLQHLLAIRKTSGSADVEVAELLLGPGYKTTVASGPAKSMDPGKITRDSFAQVLELQKVPQLQTLLDLAEAARSVADNKNPPAKALEKLDSALAKIPAVELSKAVKQGKTGKAIEAGDPEKIKVIAAHLRQKATAKKVNPKDLEKIDDELMAELAPVLRVALSGLVYAFYLRPDDLLVAEDPLLVRKHQFVDLTANGPHPQEFAATDLRQGEEAAHGAFFIGGFADFAIMASQASLAGSKYDQANAGFVAAAQIGAIRGTLWRSFNDSDQRLAGLKLRVAREWCVRAAFDPKARADLAEELLGIVSLTRRLDFLTGLANQDWIAVRQAMTLTDLYRLADRYLARYDKDPWPSPAAAALRESASTGSSERLMVLGPLLPDVLGCNHPHLSQLPPFEEFEHQTPAAMAQRIAEFKLYLAEYLDRRGYPAETIGIVAEPLLRRMLGNLAMTDPRDWRSVLANYAKISDDAIEESLPKK